MSIILIFFIFLPKILCYLKIIPVSDKCNGTDSVKHHTLYEIKSPNDSINLIYRVNVIDYHLVK